MSATCRCEKPVRATSEEGKTSTTCYTCGKPFELISPPAPLKHYRAGKWLPPVAKPHKELRPRNTFVGLSWEFDFSKPLENVILVARSYQCFIPRRLRANCPWPGLFRLVSPRVGVQVISSNDVPFDLFHASHRAGMLLCTREVLQYGTEFSIGVDVYPGARAQLPDALLTGGPFTLSIVLSGPVVETWPASP